MKRVVEQWGTEILALSYITCEHDGRKWRLYFCHSSSMVESILYSHFISMYDHSSKQGVRENRDR